MKRVNGFYEVAHAGRVYKTNGINIVRVNGVTVPNNTWLFALIIKLFKDQLNV
jgi:hypothetical protein